MEECAGVQETVVQVLARFREVVGEALMPHFCFSNSPQVNSSSLIQSVLTSGAGELQHPRVSDPGGPLAQ